MFPKTNKPSLIYLVLGVQIDTKYIILVPFEFFHSELFYGPNPIGPIRLAIFSIILVFE